MPEQTKIRGKQIALSSIPRVCIDAAFETFLSQIQTDVTNIFSQMSTDTERLAAVSALTTAFQNSDSTLQTAIVSLVNSTKAGAGLEADGSFVVPTGQNYLTGAGNIKAAVKLLDTALKTEIDSRATLTTNLANRATALEANNVTYISYDKMVFNEAPTGLTNGINVLFTLANIPYTGTCMVFVDGTLKDPTVHYSIIGKDITFTTAPANGSRVKVSYFR